MTAVITSSVAENAVCWCEGRNTRNPREKKLRRTGADFSLAGWSEFGTQGRFYTRTVRAPGEGAWNGTIRQANFGNRPPDLPAKLS
jgi:hypothetical protein